MVNTNVIARLLDELKSLSDTSSLEAKHERHRLWEEIAETLGMKSSQLNVELSSRLGVSPATVSRWQSGQFAPRSASLKELRLHFGTIPTAEPGTNKSLGLAPDPPVPFAGTYAAFRTLNHFFFCLQFAEACFVLKGLMRFQAGEQQKTRSTLYDVLSAARGALSMYYVFPKDSKASSTFDAIIDGMKSDYPKLDSTVLTRIKSIPVHNEKGGIYGLTVSYASPFICFYNDEGRSRFRRRFDVWYEIPVEPLTPDNTTDDVQRLLSYVQLPSNVSKKLVKTWYPELKALLRSSGYEMPNLDSP